MVDDDYYNPSSSGSLDAAQRNPWTKCLTARPNPGSRKRRPGYGEHAISHSSMQLRTHVWAKTRWWRGCRRHDTPMPIRNNSWRRRAPSYPGRAGFVRIQDRRQGAPLRFASCCACVPAPTSCGSFAQLRSELCALSPHFAGQTVLAHPLFSMNPLATRSRISPNGSGWPD